MARMTQADRANRLLNEPVQRVIPSLAIPTIISMLVTAVYNMADTYFVGQIGTSASAAVGVLFSAMSIIQAIAFMIGIGCGSNMSQCLGAGRIDEAKAYVSQGFVTAFLCGIVVAVLCLSNTETLVHFLGATDTITPYAVAYATYIFYAAPFMMCSFVMNNLLRFQGLAIYGMVGMTTGGILNIILDPIFIFALNLGTAGAAIATAISQVVGFTILLVMSNTRQDALHINPLDFRPNLQRIGRMLYTGFPSLGRQGIASIATILLNKTAGVYGDAAIAAMSIVTRYTMFINSAVIGFGQGFQPVCAFSWGAGRYSRVREAFRFCVKVSTTILLCLACISFLFSGSIIQTFRDDPDVIEIGTKALRFQLIALPLWGLIVMGNMFTQSIGYGAQATLMSISRQGIFLIPLLILLPRFLGLLGVQAAQPLADALSFLLALTVLTITLRKIRKMPDNPEPLPDSRTE